LDAKQPTLTDEEKEAIKEYPKLKKDYDNLKTKNDKEIAKLKNDIKIKNTEIDKLKGWKTQPDPSSLVDQINQKIIQAYNSTDYLNGYYEKLMKQFLN
jgi:Skp family chaperone for outer membrane proteins